jgi:hypothetical protein
MTMILRKTALALAAAGMALSVPAAARDHSYADHGNRYEQSHRDRYGYDTRYYGRGYNSQTAYRQSVWRGNDGRYYCRGIDGTTGLIVGAAAGALLGNAVDGGHNRTLGTVLGGAIGALLGKSVAQSSSCH